MTTDPNPQPWTFSAYEAAKLEIEMTPAGDITGQTYELNIRKQDPDGTLVLHLTTFTVENITIGLFAFFLTSAQTGTVIGPGDFAYDVWRIDTGNEKRLVWGFLTVKGQQWKP